MPATATPNLIQRIRESDRAAQNEWFSRYRNQLTRWTAVRAGVSPGHGGDASDVVHNVVPEVLNGIPDDIETPEQLFNWVRRRLRFRAIDLGRKRVLHGLAPGAGGSASGGSLTPGGQFAAGITSPSLQVVRKEREDYLLERPGADEDVSPEDFVTDTAILLLRQIDEVPLKVIAGCLGLDRVAVARRYYAALGPVRAGLDALTVGNWPADQDTDREKMFRALAQLTEEQRDVVELCHLEHEAYPVLDRKTGTCGAINCRYSLREAGDVFGLTENAAGGRVYRAMQRLTELLRSA
jgi:DNA-directed RNA polymerase specialized sigma24 family protein